MLIALFADIHANRQAFEACLDHARAQGSQRYVFLGDYVGYGADPDWVLTTVMEMVAQGALAVLGNHDNAINVPGETMNSEAQVAIDWSRGQLGPDQRRFLANLPLTLQAKMLRAVEYGEVQRVGSLEARKADVFAVAATNRDLRASAAQGTFRSDLYFRLSTIELHIPPLRDRREDIPYLTASFIREFANKMNRPIKGITAQAERMLQQAAWTGNVRELRNVIERACILTDYRIITEREMTTAMSTVPTSVAGMSDVVSGSPGVVSGFSRTGDTRTNDPESTLMSTAQREQILRVLKQVNGNNAAAAKQLGVSRRSLYRWLERLDIPQ